MVESELSARASRLLALEAQIKAREREADKAARTAEGAKAVQADCELQAS